MKLDFSEKNPNRNPLFLHPILLDAVEQIVPQVEASIGPEFDVRIISTLRTPEEQFKLFQQGRLYPGRIVTRVDGFQKLSTHNYQPSQACDLGIFRKADGAYLGTTEMYEHIGPPTREAGLKWGGDFQSFFDAPHIEIQPHQLFGEIAAKALPSYGKPISAWLAPI